MEKSNYFLFFSFTFVTRWWLLSLLAQCDTGCSLMYFMLFFYALHRWLMQVKWGCHCRHWDYWWDQEEWHWTWTRELRDLANTASDQEENTNVFQCPIHIRCAQFGSVPLKMRKRGFHTHSSLNMCHIATVHCILTWCCPSPFSPKTRFCSVGKVFSNWHTPINKCTCRKFDERPAPVIIDVEFHPRPLGMWQPTGNGVWVTWWKWNHMTQRVGREKDGEREREREM